MSINFGLNNSEPVYIKKRKRKMPLNEDRTGVKRPLQIPYGGVGKQKQSYTSENNSKNLYADISHRNNGLNNWSKFKELELKTKSPLSKLVTNNTVRLQKVSLVKSIHNSGKDRHNYKVSLHNRAKPHLAKCVAIDCEMVGVEEDGKDDMVARVSLVNAFGECIYDKFVKPMEPVVDYRTYVSGVRPKDLENGEDFKVVQKEVADILKGKKLIGHALKNDLKVLFLTHPKWAIRDTSRYQKLREGFKSTPALKKLVDKYLGVKIQEGEHNSVEDANAAMQLYLMHRKEWEEDLKRKRRGHKITTHKLLTNYAPDKLTADNV